MYDYLRTLTNEAVNAVESIDEPAKRYAKSVRERWNDQQGAKIAEEIVALVTGLMDFSDKIGNNLLDKIISFRERDLIGALETMEQTRKDMEGYKIS